MKPRYPPVSETDEKLGIFEMKLENIKKFDVVEIRFELRWDLGLLERLHTHIQEPWTHRRYRKSTYILAGAVMFRININLSLQVHLQF